MAVLCLLSLPLPSPCDAVLSVPPHSPLSYDIYTPCINGNGESASPRRRVPGTPRIGGPDGCIDGIAAGAYLNTASVQTSINVISAAQYYGTWDVCSNKVDYTSTASNLPKNVYPALISKYRVLIYNGDVDACVPYNDNEMWTSGMGYTASAAWHAWSVSASLPSPCAPACT